MLRITKFDEDHTGVILKLEGRIASDWVDEVERECRRALAQRQRVRLDLRDVTFVDRRGARALRALRGERLHIVNCPALIRDLLETGDTD